MMRWLNPELAQAVAKKLTFACLTVVFLMAEQAQADNWPQWRGSDALGVASEGSYPIEWSTSEGIAWQYELPGVGASTPVIWEDKIILTGELEGKNSVLCLDRAGKKVWEIGLGEYVQARNRKASGCNSSPVTDGEMVFAYFKSGEFAAVDLDGNVKWQKNLQDEYGEDTLWWDLGTSPVLTKSHVIVACMQTGPSYLVAFDKATGEVAWKHERKLDAPGESAQSYTTPVVVEREGREIIVVLGADHVTAHDATNGDEIWRVGGLNPGRAGNWRSISSPVVYESTVFAPYARGRSMTAIAMGGEGDVTESHVRWSNQGPAADVPSPVASNGLLYVCTDRGSVASIDMESGETVSELSLPRKRNQYSASPVLAGGHLYVTNEDGTIFVVKVGEELELAAENAMEDFAVASPIFCDGRIYIRTDKHLHCIGAAE